MWVRFLHAGPSINTNMILIEEAKKLSFDPNDPFDLGYFIMDNAKSYIPNEAYPDFVKECYYSLFESILMGEVNAGIQYKFLAENTNEELIKNYFLKMAEEERIHGEILGIIVDSMFDAGTAEKINLKYVDTYEYSVLPTHKNLLTTILLFFIVETKLISGFATSYSDCKNISKKNFIANFLAEESQHISAILEIIKYLSLKYSSRELALIYKFYIDQVKIRKFYLFSHLTDRFDNSEELKNIYQSEWHVRSIDKVNNRLYKAAEIINPSETFENFVKITNPI